MELVHDDPDSIHLCQVVSIQSQSAIQETLRDFSRGTRKMLLLMANMQVRVLYMYRMYMYIVSMLCVMYMYSFHVHVL